MKTRQATCALILVTLLITASAWAKPAPTAGQDAPHKGGLRTEVVFVLDTTGSMSGLINGAKRKIWSIVNEMTQGQEKPDLRVGLIGYRDRGDEYVTRRTDLTRDVDAIFEKLMAFSAGGGGDGPEDVNRALHEAVTRMSWTEGRGVLRMVFLVGDAPPHMDYNGEPTYPEICSKAKQKDIFVNTIQAGSSSSARKAWTKIAGLAGGKYFAIPQDGGMLAVATPFDDKLAELTRKLDETTVAYGAKDKRRRVIEKKKARTARTTSFSSVAGADRAGFMAKGGAAAPEEDLVDALAAKGDGALAGLDKEELPEPMQGNTQAENMAILKKKAEERRRIQREIAEISAQRKGFIAEQKKAAPSAAAPSFDDSVLEAVEVQSALAY